MKLRDSSIEKISPEILSLAEKHFERQQRVRKAITDELSALSPAVGTSDPAKVAAHLELFVDEMTRQYEFELNEATGAITLFRDGSRVENPQGYALELSEVVRQEASSRYELFSKETPAPQGAPIRFRDNGDYVNRFFAAKSHEERSALVESWRKQQQTA